MVFPEDRLMAKMFNEEMAKFYEKYYENKGVTLIKGDTVTGFEGDGKVQSMSASLHSSIYLVLAGHRRASTTAAHAHTWCAYHWCSYVVCSELLGVCIAWCRVAGPA